MTSDRISAALKESAARWETPPFDPAAIAVVADVRRRRARRLGLGSLLGIALLAGAITLAVLGTRHHTVSKPDAKGSTSPRTLDMGSAPGAPPPVRIKPLQRTGERVDRASVLVRVAAGTPATVRARLGFYKGAPGRVRDTAIVVARPGTEPAAAPAGSGSYYRWSRVAISAKVDATSPTHRILRVTTPADLPPGVYPVLTVVRTVLLPGQQPGIHGPYQMTSELGVIVITKR